MTTQNSERCSDIPSPVPTVDSPSPQSSQETTNSSTTASSVKSSGHRQRQANLRPWKKGQSGNPSGQSSKSRTLHEAILAYLDKPGKFPEFVERLYKEDIRTFAMYGFGKPAETLQIEVEDRRAELNEFARAAARKIMAEMREKQAQLPAVTVESQPIEIDPHTGA